MSCRFAEEDMTKELASPGNVEVGDCIFVKPDILAQYQARIATFPQKNKRPCCLVLADRREKEFIGQSQSPAAV